MRKRIINEESDERKTDHKGWLDLERLARIELTSEDPAHPFESVLSPGFDSSWRASKGGEQRIRILFDEPLRIGRIRLIFQEAEHERTQEYVLRWSPDGGGTYEEIVRQQYNFSPAGTTQEIEEYSVRIGPVSILELVIIPDIQGRDLRASLSEFRLAKEPV